MGGAVSHVVWVVLHGLLVRILRYVSLILQHSAGPPVEMLSVARTPYVGSCENPFEGDGRRVA